MFEYAKQTDSINCGVICLKFLESFKDKEKGPQMCMTCNYDDDSLIKYMGYLLDVLNKHSKTVSIPAHQHSAFGWVGLFLLNLKPFSLQMVAHHLFRLKL